jgi:hypothetical protein
VVAALIKFVQGANVGVAGQALLGVVGTPVVVSNASDTNVARWRYTVIDAPPSSALTPGTVQDGTTPTWTWTPDTTDMVEVQLDVFDGTGLLTARDSRCFGVNRASGRIIPAFTAVAAAVNFLGQLRGWAVIMEAWLNFLDGLVSGGSPNARIDIEIPVTTATVSSAGSITSTRRVSGLKVRVDTPYSAGTIGIGHAGAPSLLLAPTGTTPSGTMAIDIVNCPAGYIYDLSPTTYLPFGATDPVLVTMAGAVGGVLVVLVTYSSPAG